ncbi:MAG: YqhA family protein, partial [Actinobacteria bacterium]|nr:YqhA family protein [Actinomycetota bacterium]
ATVEASLGALTGEVDLNHLLVEYIEFADIFLLGIVLYILALGVFSLFIDDRIPLPRWLEIHDLDDLKEKLVSVVGVVLGVFFMGRLINGQETIDTLFMGIGIAAVIIALAYFVKSVMKP